MLELQAKINHWALIIMQLALHTDYALRVLLMLAANRGKRVTLNDIAQRYDISKEHLRKVVHHLAKLGIIDTFRGKAGGLELKQAPSTINIGELIAATEPQRPVINCNAQPCILTSVCDLKSALAAAEHAFYDTLKRYTLADLCRQPHAIALLQLPT